MADVGFEDKDLPEKWNISLAGAASFMATFPFLVAGTYVAGYVTATTYYTAYEVPTSALFNSRYLAAGLLWLFWTGIPTIAALIAIDYAGTHWRTKYRLLAIASPVLIPLFVWGAEYLLLKSSIVQ